MRGAQGTEPWGTNVCRTLGLPAQPPSREPETYDRRGGSVLTTC